MKNADKSIHAKPVIPYWVLIAVWLAAGSAALWYGDWSWTPREVAGLAVVAALAIGIYVGERGARRK